MELKITVYKRKIGITELQIKNDDLNIGKEIQITNQMRDQDYFILDLPKGFAGVATLRIQNGLDKDEIKNF